MGNQLRQGMAVTACVYLDAQRRRAELAGRARRLLSQHDLLVSPTAPVTAPRRDDYERFLMRLSRTRPCGAWWVGCPAFSLPVGSAAGLPVGLQLVAGEHRDRFLAQAGVALEDAHAGGGLLPERNRAATGAKPWSAYAGCSAMAGGAARR